MPKEIHPNDLLDYLHEPENKPDQFHQDNIQVCLVQLFQPETEMAFSSWIDPAPVFKPNPEAIRQWVRHFSNSSSPMPTVIIPDNWMNFFTFTLLQSPSFDWAKSFLQSSAWDFFTVASSGNSTVFHLPKACPVSNLQIYSSSVIIEEINSESDSVLGNDDIPESSNQANKTPRAKKGKKPVLSESDVRRSLRIKKLHKGFKVLSCKEKACLGCNSTPLEVSTSIIRDPGATFCNINPEELNDDNLNKKPSLSARKLERRRLVSPQRMGSSSIFCP